MALGAGRRLAALEGRGTAQQEKLREGHWRWSFARSHRGEGAQAAQGRHPRAWGVQPCITPRCQSRLRDWRCFSSFSETILRGNPMPIEASAFARQPALGEFARFARRRRGRERQRQSAPAQRPGCRAACMSPCVPPLLASRRRLRGCSLSQNLLWQAPTASNSVEPRAASYTC